MDIIRKSVSLLASMWQDIGEWRFANRIPTEAEAIRRLLEMALEVERRKAARRSAP